MLKEKTSYLISSDVSPEMCTVTWDPRAPTALSRLAPRFLYCGTSFPFPQVREGVQTGLLSVIFGNESRAQTGSVMQSMNYWTVTFWKDYLWFYYQCFYYSIYFPIMTCRKRLSQEGPDNGSSKEMGYQDLFQKIIFNYSWGTILCFGCTT